MTTIDLLTEIMDCYFNKHDTDKIISYLAEDIHCYGLAAGLKIEGLEYIRRLLGSEHYRQFMDYRFEIRERDELGDDAGSLSYSLTFGNVKLNYRLTGSSRVSGSARRIYLLHFSLDDSYNVRSLYSELALKKQNEIARSVMKSAVPGGIMGGYIEAGFPFYCINDNMLQYLGYSSEKQFVDDIDGLLDNCIHPDDREYVGMEIAKQFEQQDTYKVEYRMRKKDGSYIYVHDIGRRTKTDDGRDAIISACYDITTEKEHFNFVHQLINSMNASMVVYTVENDGKRIVPVQASETVGTHIGMSRDGYMEKYKLNALDSVYPKDRDKVLTSVMNTVESGTPGMITIRVFDNNNGTVWTNAFFSKCSDIDGKPAIRSVFSPAPMQYDAQIQALSQSNIGVCVINEKTDELYYANDAAFELHDVPVCNYSGKTCYEIFFGRNEKCADCWRKNEKRNTVYYCNERILEVSSESHEWNNRNVSIVYQQDITEKQKLQQSVEASNREFQELLQNTVCGLCVSTVDKNKNISIKYISEGFCKLFEGTRDKLIELYTAQPFAGVHAEDMPEVTRVMDKCHSEPGTNEMTYRYTTVKGTRLWITLKTMSIPDNNGGLRIYGTYFDITEKMIAQKQLYDVVHNVPGGICMYRWDGKKFEPLIVSTQVARLFGTGESDVAQRHLAIDSDTVHPDDIYSLRRAVAKIIDNPEHEDNYSYRIWNAEKGCYRWIRTSAVCIDQGDGTKIIYANYSDINDEKELEQNLLQKDEMLQSACDFAHIWAWVYDMQNDSIRCFRQLQTDFGMPEVLDGYPDSWLEMGFVQPESIEIHRDKVLAVKNGSDNEEFEAKIRHKDGSLHWARVKLNRLSDNPYLAICTAQLIDDEKYLLARIDVEEKQQSEAGVNMLAHFVTNLTQEKPVSYTYRFDETEEYKKWSSLSSQLELTKKQIVNPAKRREFLEMHDSRRLVERFISGNPSQTFDYRRRFSDGKIIWVRTVIHMVRDPKTGDILNYESLYNIHQQKIGEELMSTVISFGYEICASLMVDSNQVTLLRSHQIYGKNELVVENYTEANEAYAQSIIDEDRKMYLRETSIKNIVRRLRTENHFEITHRTLENGKIHFKKDQCYSYDGDNTVCILVRSDITDLVTEQRRKQDELQKILDQRQEALDSKEEVMRDRERIYAALFSIVPIVISSNITKNYYVMLNYNNYTTRVAAESGIYDKLISAGTSAVPDDQKAVFAETFSRESVMREYENGRKFVVLEHRQLGDDGIIRWMETRCIFVKSDKDGDLYTITMAQDITERRNQQQILENALEAANSATKAKSEFLSRMSHEIRTPMNAIIGMTAIAKESRSDFKQISECLEKIDMSGHFLLTLINDILEMSRIESGRTEIKYDEFNFDFLVDSIRTVVEPLALKRDIRLEFQNSSGNEPYYVGDAMRIQQVLVNIITNAIKFTKQGGKVRFNVDLQETDEQMAFFDFSVADTGIGMSEEFMSRMFTPFTQEDGSNTSEFGGSGLGLAISKSLVEAMNGKITVESFLGIGSTFTVSLPLKRVGHTAENQDKKDLKNGAIDYSLLDGCCILMAEDHPLNVMVATKLLERKGVVVTVAENGKVAVDKFLASKPGFFKAILMDIRMPVMDGLDAAKKIRSLERDDARTVPIIAMTANAMEEDRRHSFEAGMNSHLAKPFEPDQLYDVLARQLAGAK